MDPEAAKRASLRYACLSIAADPQTYGYLTSLGVKKNCVKETIEQLLELQYTHLNMSIVKSATEDEYFYAMQNARLVKNAEGYYRSMFEGRRMVNVRDRHMMETLQYSRIPSGKS